jgi:hypothetical protein
MSRWFETMKQGASADHAEMHFRHGLALVIAGMRSQSSARPS